MPGLVLEFARLGVTDELLLEQAQVTLDEAAEQWVIGVVSRQAGGRVVLPKQWGPAGLVKVDLDYLVLPDSEAAGEAPQPPGHGADPREQPNLMLHVRRLSHGDRPVGELLLRTVTLANGLGVEELLLTGDGWRVDGSGRWAWREDTPYTELELEFSSSALDTLLHSLGYDGQFERAPTSASLVIDWPGSPDRFSRRTLGGRLDIDVGEGVIRDLAPGAGRVFGLINLAQIGRRVRLDFSDLTERGLAFDAIRGHFLIDEGNAYTNDLALTGPAVEISVMGRIGLVRRDYDELVTVVPQVSGSLPIAGAMLGGPAVGAALLVFDRLLGEQVNRLSQVQYTLTGSWDDPRLERFKGLPEPVSSPP
jgi:uncharacterized protein YhdP